MKPYFSIIIPTLNEEKFLPTLLQNLADQTFKDFEVIVVDGNSSDKTVSQAQLFDNNLKLRINISPVKNVGYQRNLGMKISKGQWLLFTDADNILNHDFLSQIVDLIKSNPKLDIATFSMKAPSSNLMLSFTIMLSNFLMKLYSRLKPVSGVGGIILSSKEVANKVHFNSSETLFEEIDFIKDVIRQGAKYHHLSIQYTISSRRIDYHPLWRTILIDCAVIIYYLTGEKILSYKEYPMEGGGQYDN